MRESALVKKLMARLKAAGWWCVKIHGGPYQRAGLPDIWAVKAGRLLCIEAKRPGERATKLQEHTLAELSAAGATTAVISSIDELDDLIRPN